MTFADKERRIPSIWLYTWRTNEPLARVWNFYAQKCGHDKQFAPQSLGVFNGTHGKATYHIDNRFTLPDFKLRTAVFVYNSPDIVATVVVHPPDDKNEIFVHLSISDRTHTP